MRVSVSSAISPKPFSLEKGSVELSGGLGDGVVSTEGVDAKVACVPCMPTQQEVEIHNATHVPFRSWCPYCVAGKAKANPHFRKASDRVQSENIVSLDYAFIGDRKDADSDADDETEEVDHRDSSGNLKVLVSRDHNKG